jgi:two-component system OmpR family response regulator
MSYELKRVLCIDDDTDILEVVKICLETVGGFEVLTCSTGTEAVETIRNTMPDLVLLDVMMPGMDGPTIIKALQADVVLAPIPVVFMTARIQPREVDEYLSYGATAVIAKPFDPMLIAQQIADIWKKAQTGKKTA